MGFGSVAGSGAACGLASLVEACGRTGTVTEAVRTAPRCLLATCGPPQIRATATRAAATAKGHLRRGGGGAGASNTRLIRSVGFHFAIPNCPNRDYNELRAGSDIARVPAKTSLAIDFRHGSVAHQFLQGGFHIAFTYVKACGRQTRQQLCRRAREKMATFRLRVAQLYAHRLAQRSNTQTWGWDGPHVPRF